ncbi:sodium:solute symporter family protein [candidate division KSB1 bacterium]|nr:sodium:solute symporter family protein [candidate division KSB1 bacterium]
MTLVDFVIFFIYLLLVVMVGVYFFRKNTDREDYYVGGRSIKSHHIGLSIVATDVGGGFSIGLGGLGFVMGLSGSWLLFTGLVGAWLSAVFMIPKIKKLDREHGMITFPDFLRYRYGNRVALMAAIISGIGYLGFTGGQILAGAKLAAGTVFANLPPQYDPLNMALIVMTIVIIGYTVLGGIKAVIYTDTVQWIILLSGLLVAIPFALANVGGMAMLKAELAPEFFRLDNLHWSQFVNWFVTIVPIWFIAMTLYQRVYATRNEKEAKKAWFIAGIFEYPVIAFLGVFLGMVSRVLFPEVDAEMGLPMLLKSSLPIGITGIVIAAYFSAIMSTADSCLIASSGNFVNDILERYVLTKPSQKTLMLVSQAITLVIGALTFLIAYSFQTVLEIILHAYSFMVAGLFVPTLGAYFWKKSHPSAAFYAMMVGGTTTLIMIFMDFSLPFGLDASFYGILISLIVFVFTSIWQDRKG